MRADDRRAQHVLAAALVDGRRRAPRRAAPGSQVGLQRWRRGVREPNPTNEKRTQPARVWRVSTRPVKGHLAGLQPRTLVRPTTVLRRMSSVVVAAVALPAVIAPLARRAAVDDAVGDRDAAGVGGNHERPGDRTRQLDLEVRVDGTGPRHAEALARRRDTVLDGAADDQGAVHQRQPSEVAGHVDEPLDDDAGRA